MAVDDNKLVPSADLGALVRVSISSTTEAVLGGPSILRPLSVVKLGDYSVLLLTLKHAWSIQTKCALFINIILDLGGEQHELS